MYKERYGAWPPRHWSEQVKSEFASDELWQSRLAIRLERKVLLEEQERREEQGSSDTISEDQIVRSEDDSFADWLHDRGIFSVVDECGPNKPQPGRT
jgi:hypothetical protein